MKKATLKKIFLGCLSFSLLLFGSVAAYTTSTKTYKEPKSVVDDETVYALLSPEGKVRETVVVDWLRAEGEGYLLIEDVNPGSEIEVLKSTPKPQIINGNLGFIVKSKSFADVYYRTAPKKDLPLQVEIKYELNGRAVSPEELAGKSGKLKVSINFKNKLKKKVVVKFETADGKVVESEKEIYIPLFVVANVNLDSSKFNNIKVENGWLSAQGSKYSLNWFSFPQGEDDISFEADAKNIEIPSLVVSAMPRMPQEIDLEIRDQFKSLYNGLKGLSKLSSAHELMLSGIYSRINTEQFSQISSAKSGFTMISSGLEASAEGIDGLSTLTDAYIQILDGMINSLQTDSLKNIGELSNGLSQLKTGIDAINAGLLQLKAGTEAHSLLLTQAMDLNLSALEIAEEISQETTDQTKINELKTLLNTQKSVLSTSLNGGYISPSQLIPSLADISASISQISANLNAISQQLNLIIEQTGQLSQLPANLEMLKGSLIVLRDGGELQGSYLPGLKSVKENLKILSESLLKMKSGIDSASSKMGALESLPDALLQLKKALDTVVYGGYMNGTKVPGVKDSTIFLSNMAEGISVGYERMSEGKAVQDTLKAEAEKYDSFLGRMHKPNYSGRLRFIFKVEEVKKK